MAELRAVSRAANFNREAHTLRISRCLVGAAAALLAVSRAPRAQGITTGAIAGRVTDHGGEPLSGAQIVIRNRPTGFSAGAQTREDGRYRVQNLEPGGPYTVTARRIGMEPQTVENQLVPLSQTLTLDFKLSAQAATLSLRRGRRHDERRRVQRPRTPALAPHLRHRPAALPTTTRNLTDFVKIAPQVSSTGPGASAGGMSNRMNNVQIDGATERDVFGLGSTARRVPRSTRSRSRSRR